MVNKKVTSVVLALAASLIIAPIPGLNLFILMYYSNIGIHLKKSMYTPDGM